ncbi:MAG: hypothetical protein R3325_01065 [Thermoanaerobaculia bacterium]|nr:hypothetical protein [Thermoanaerobaculia bacterium]
MKYKLSRRIVAAVAAVVVAAVAAAPATAGVKKFRKKQPRPVQLGTSAGNAEDFSLDPPFISCAGGTAGALLKMEDPEDPDGELYFILSNNHVLALGNQGSPGDEIVQPGLIDTDCESASEDAIAHLSSFKKIKFGGKKRNHVDMAIAEVVDGAVRENGKILRLGVPGNGVVDAEPGQKVKKSGRTTGFTRGDVFLVDTDVLVDFLSSGATKTALFRNQDVVESRNRDFSGGGDSGAVVYLDAGKCSPAIGLLFAGNANFTALNPMERVLGAAKKLRPRGEKTLVGCDSPVAAVAAFSAREDRGFRNAQRVKERFADRVLEIDGVVGVGVGREKTGTGDAMAVLRVLVERADDETLAEIPGELDGVPVRVVVTGRFKAF